jgi:NitT/TauT family transport system substrate-binding protein
MKKTVFYALAVLMLSTAFESCTTKSNKIKVGYLPIAECLPLYVAKEKGYFEKYGLEVELVSESGGPAVFKELEAGAIEIGFSNVVTLVKQNNAGKDYNSVFGATYETATNINHAIFGRKDSPISLDSNAKFGVNARNNVEELMLLHFLKGKGMTLNKKLLTHFVEVPFPQMLSSLRDKNIDYGCVVEPSITIAKNDTISLKYVGNHYPATESNKVLVATYVSKKSTINAKKKDIDSFIKAMSDATDYINGKNADPRDFIKKYAKIDEKLLPKISLPEFSAKIDETELSEIIELMYSTELNFNNSFIANPENKISATSLIFKYE